MRVQFRPPRRVNLSQTSRGMSLVGHAWPRAAVIEPGVIHIPQSELQTGSRGRIGRKLGRYYLRRRGNSDFLILDESRTPEGDTLSFSAPALAERVPGAQLGYAGQKRVAFGELPQPSSPKLAIDGQAKLFRDMRNRVVDGNEWFTARDLAELSGSRAENARAFASRLNKQAAIPYWELNGANMYPRYAFVLGEGRLSVNAVVAQVTQLFRNANWSNWSILMWFDAQCSALENRCPKDTLDEPDAVIAAANEALAPVLHG